MDTERIKAPYIIYSNSLRVRNTKGITKSKGRRYLLCKRMSNGEFEAMCWCKKWPNILNKEGRLVIVFSVISEGTLEQLKEEK